MTSTVWCPLWPVFVLGQNASPTIVPAFDNVFTYCISSVQLNIIIMFCLLYLFIDGSADYLLVVSNNFLLILLLSVVIVLLLSSFYHYYYYYFIASSSSLLLLFFLLLFFVFFFPFSPQQQHVKFLIYIFWRRTHGNNSNITMNFDKANAYAALLREVSIEKACQLA